MGRSQLRSLRWLSSTHCEHSLLLSIGVHQSYVTFQFYMSVGLVRLSLTVSRGLRSVFFVYRDLTSNALTGPIPAQISGLVKLEHLCALTSFFIKCWSKLFSLLFLTSDAINAS